MSTASEQPSLGRSVIGAIVLFPAIVAGIMGLGWGLERIAESKAPTAPAPEADGRVTLNIYEALIRGDSILAQSREAPAPYIDRWKNIEDTVEWRFEMPQGGRYKLEVTYCCKEDLAGGEYEVTVGAQTIQGKVADSGGENKLRTDALGEVTFESPGWKLITFKPRQVPGDNLMRLSGVSFVPVR